MTTRFISSAVTPLSAPPISRPLFQRYVPIEVDPHREDWQAILDVDGVVDVLRMPGSDVPGYVSQAKIHLLMRAEAVGIFDRTTIKPNHFQLNELVRVTDGPFAESKELIAGFCLIHAKSTDEAIEWAKRVPFEEGEIELRPLYELFDFPVEAAEKPDGWRAQEEQLRAAPPA